LAIRKPAAKLGFQLCCQVADQVSAIIGTFFSLLFFLKNSFAQFPVHLYPVKLDTSHCLCPGLPNNVEFHFVKTIMDVLEIVLLKTKVKKAVKIGDTGILRIFRIQFQINAS
jgi:hypothetical protein